MHIFYAFSFIFFFIITFITVFIYKFCTSFFSSFNHDLSPIFFDVNFYLRATSRALTSTSERQGQYIFRIWQTRRSPPQQEAGGEYREATTRKIYVPAPANVSWSLLGGSFKNLLSFFFFFFSRGLRAWPQGRRYSLYQKNNSFVFYFFSKNMFFTFFPFLFASLVYLRKIFRLSAVKRPPKPRGRGGFFFKKNILELCSSITIFT